MTSPLYLCNSDVVMTIISQQTNDILPTCPQVLKYKKYRKKKTQYK